MTQKATQESNHRKKDTISYRHCESITNRQSNPSFTQSGRSMVEMLGVLAVMAVLTIGGIAGYNYAVNKYKTNETLNEVKGAAFIVSAQLMQDKKNVSLENEYTRLGYKISTQITPRYENYFDIVLDDVPPKICRQMLKMDWKLPAQITVGIIPYSGNADICGNASTPDTIYYTFDQDLQSGDEILPEDRPTPERCKLGSDCKCGTCMEGVCQTNCLDNQTCSKNYDSPNEWMCCLNQNVMNGLCCSVIFKDQCCNSVGTCCPADKPLQSKDGTCYTCDTSSLLLRTDFANDSCLSMCPNREITGEVGQHCALPCPADKPLRNSYGGCYPCSQEGIYISGLDNDGDCLSCPNRYVFQDMERKMCLTTQSCPDGQFRTSYPAGACVGCGVAAASYFYSTPQECAKCPGREYGFLYGNKCQLTCGTPGTGVANKPLPDMDGTCYACNDPNLIPMTYPTFSNIEKCSVICPNRIAQGNYCILK